MQMHARVSQATTDDTRAAAPGFFSAATTMVINTHTRWYQRVLINAMPVQSPNLATSAVAIPTELGRFVMLVA